MTREPQPASESTTQLFAPSIAMRSYLSTHQLWTARHLTGLAQQLEDKHEGRAKFSIRQRAYVSAAVLSACAFLEAAINELFQDVADGHESYIQALSTQTRKAFEVYWEESEGRAEPLSKYQIALGLAGCDLLDRGAEPFQSAKLLVFIRNLLVHFTPETAASANDKNKLEVRINKRFPDNKLMVGAGNPFWPDKCLGAGCASWAVSSATTLADEAFGRLKVQPNYQRIDWPTDVE